VGEFENGKMRLGNPVTKRAGGAIHLIHPDPTGGPKPLCRPAYSNKSNYAKGVPDDKPVTCLLCINIETARQQEGRHKA